MYFTKSQNTATSGAWALTHPGFMVALLGTNNGMDVVCKASQVIGALPLGHLFAGSLGNGRSARKLDFPWVVHGLSHWRALCRLARHTAVACMGRSPPEPGSRIVSNLDVFDALIVFFLLPKETLPNVNSCRHRNLIGRNRNSVGKIG